MSDPAGPSVGRAAAGAADLGAAAAMLQTADPALFRAALLAPEPGRGRLMLLGAFDVELSRAVERTAEGDEGAFLAAMRLQFWRDRLEEAATGTSPGAPAPQHNVAGPLVALMAGPLAGARADAAQLIESRTRELEAPFDTATWAIWAEARFGAWYRLALAALGRPMDAAARAA
ncbi:MAG: squalene/phytoene synthase family protein, partial [Pseudomonadota bacterium]